MDGGTALTGALTGALGVIAVTLIRLTGPAGQRIDINPADVTSIREPRGVDRGHWVAGTRCLVVMVNGKFIAVTEDCDTVRLMVGAAK